MDKDGNGILSPDEVICVIRELMGYDEKTARYFVTLFDKNQDGSLDKAEFIHMWTDMFGWASFEIEACLIEFQYGFSPLIILTFNNVEACSLRCICVEFALFSLFFHVIRCSTFFLVKLQGIYSSMCSGPINYNFWIFILQSQCSFILHDPGFTSDYT